MNGEDIIGYLVKLLEEQEQIKITYSLGGGSDDNSNIVEVCRSQRS